MNLKILQFVIFGCFMAAGVIFSSAENNNEVVYFWVFRVECEKRESETTNNIYEIRILVNIIAVRQVGTPPKDNSSDFYLMSNECLNDSCGNYRKFSSERFKDFSISYGDGSQTEETTTSEDFEIDGIKNS